jgi:hypothetical protein
MMQIITLAQIWSAIAAQGYRMQPMSCYFEDAQPVICRMPLSQQEHAGWLTITTDGGRIQIDEHAYCFSEECG